MILARMRLVVEPLMAMTISPMPTRPVVIQRSRKPRCVAVAVSSMSYVIPDVWLQAAVEVELPFKGALRYPPTTLEHGSGLIWLKVPPGSNSGVRRRSASSRSASPTHPRGMRLSGMSRFSSVPW